MTPIGKSKNAPRCEASRSRVAVAIAILLAVAPYVIAPFYRFDRSGLDADAVALGDRTAGGSASSCRSSRIAPALPLAVILAEDGTFCHNRGIDLGAMREALEQSDDDIAEARGASTITQQVAKNLFLWQGRSVVRKVLEIPLAVWLTWCCRSGGSLEIYLNIAEWGPNGEFGAEAGARWAFGNPARDLNAEQAAELAAILPNPVQRSARNPSPLVRRLAGVYVRRAAAFPGLDACIRAAPPSVAGAVLL